MLDEHGLGEFLHAHYSRPGDQLFRMERLPLYDVPSQNADRDAFLRGVAPDWARKQAWLDELAENARRGMVSRRVRVFSAQLSDDELMSCHYGYPYIGRDQDIRVVHPGEHPVPTLLDHDYWIAEPLDGGGVHVARMHYTDGGAFVGAEPIDGPGQDVYLRERDLAWQAAEPFNTWWARHGELHRTVAT